MLFDCSSLATRDRGIDAAVEAIRRGDLVVLPTDTVYGIGADAFKPWSVTALSNAKGRTSVPPVLIGARSTLDGLVHTFSAAGRDLVDAFWPGALTIIVRYIPTLQWELGDDMDGTVAVRMPLHPVALEVLRETGPMAVSSANKAGEPAARTAEEARDQFGYSVSVYLEAGPSPDTAPSTIVDLTGETPLLIRAGAIPIEKLRAVVPAITEVQE